MGRHSIFLDASSEKKLNFILSMEGVSKSELLRKIISFYYEMCSIEHPLDIETIKVYIMLLSKGEHLIVDVAHWDLFMSLSRYFNDAFWEELNKIGREHGEQWRDRVNFVGFLKLLECCNWFSVVKMNEIKYVLISRTENSMDFIIGFLKGVCKGYGIQPRMVKLKGKILVEF